MIDDFRWALDSKMSTCSVAIDLTKAFDSICHNLLLAKLHAYGVSQGAMKFLQSYLSNRQQRVKVNGVCLTGLLFYVEFHKVAFWGHPYLIYLLMTSILLPELPLCVFMLTTLQHTSQLPTLRHKNFLLIRIFRTIYLVFFQLSDSKSYQNSSHDFGKF